MPRTFYVPPRFHPAYSLLGRGMRRLLGDARRAEALFLVALSMIALGLLLAQYVAWVVLKPLIVGAPSGPAAVAFWTAQVGALVLGVATCVVGFAPALSVTVDAAGLHLRQAGRTLSLRHAEVTSVEAIPALLFHRHYGRYAATHAFVNRNTPEVLLLKTARGPVVVGLLPDDHAALRHLLETRLAPAFDVPVARVA